MGRLLAPWGLTGALLTVVYLHSICAAAKSSINVALQTSFTSAPYLVELLETAGDENGTSYFPLLDRIADGHFDAAKTDQDLYNLFLKVLQDDGHMDAPGISSYQLALSLRSASPRIEAHYQYYHTAVEPTLEEAEQTSCPVWVHFNGRQYCSPILQEAHGNVKLNSQPPQLQFDRVVGNFTAPSSILYADITSPTFGKFHRTLVGTAREGKSSYRIRHRKPLSYDSKPLAMSGYGVELALKRTDYIVIDDRDEGDAVPAAKQVESEVSLEDEEIADLKPLSTSELSSLSVKAAGFVMQTTDPFLTLIKLSQDFPKFSSIVATQNASFEFVKEHVNNRALMVPAGMNIMWINGLQITDRQIDAFGLLDFLRRERKLIRGVQELGLTGPEAVSLLAHPDIAVVKAEDDTQRFDWRDSSEAGNVIIWLNDIEKDKRYEGWPSELRVLLQRTFPGQLPSVRRDLFNLVLPVDLSDPRDIELVVEQIQSFVKRKLPLRFGLVPLTKNLPATYQAKIVYHLLDSYGLSTALAYLEGAFSVHKPIPPSKPSFVSALEGKKLRKDKVALSLEEVLNDSLYEDRIINSQKWMLRLGADSLVPPMFINGAALPRNQDWLQSMSTRVNTDLQSIQRAVFEESFTDDDWIPDFFLAKAVFRRNALIIPEDQKSLKVFDISKIYAEHSDALKSLPIIRADSGTGKSDWAHMIVAADLTTIGGQQLLATAIDFRRSNPAIELVVLPTFKSAEECGNLYTMLHGRSFLPLDHVDELTEVLAAGTDTKRSNAVTGEAKAHWEAAQKLGQSIGLEAGQNGLLVNGRLVGPIPSSVEFPFDDFLSLIEFERKTRILPVLAALEGLGLGDKISSPLASARVSSLVATASISDVPEGIFGETNLLRISSFEGWESKYTAIESGDSASAGIRITAAVDPATEQAQRWIPILKVLSEMDGVYLKLFLNPRERNQELPVKRFYRYIFESKPTFNENGSLVGLSATFNGVPQEALLTVGMDVPPAWLVAPKQSFYDLDNIKLSSSKGDVEAVYELEHILIEGHTRDAQGGDVPRGAQLVLETERDPHFADTIIMANLGYFQFKANPGFYKISLQEGRSEEIFKIDSLGSYGWTPVPGDENSEIALMSFQGMTLYPLLSRKPGQELEDVLEAKVDSAKDIMGKGLKFAENMLGLGKTKAQVTEQADINIFSVASGHLYERMLNIMMVSVMKHTKHSVKFWFIEQFLSPSFKDFIPHMAAEYGFQYEMVTYKWPHWLRAQTEKQREIWGYKILFLDVLFPLALDKVIFVDADQIVRTDMIELVNHDLQGAPYGFTPMCDSRTEMEGFRFWKQGYWKGFLKGLPYHISALYVVDLHRFRQIAAGDRLRQQYQQLSADPGSLSNLDQDLPNHMQTILPIHSLPQEWLWCETWCSDESLTEAKTIDLCNNPMTKEPKLDRARRQVPEWTVYDDEIALVDKKRKGLGDEIFTAQKNTKSRTLEEETSTRVVDEL